MKKKIILMVLLVLILTSSIWQQPLESLVIRFALAANALLDGGTIHTDTTASDVTRGDLMIGNSTPKWDDLAIGSATTYLKSDGTDVAWDTLNLGTDTTGSYAAGDAEAGAATSGDSATSFFSSGTIEHEWGGLEADVKAYDGLVGITGGATYNQTGTTTQIIIFDGSGAPTSAALSSEATMDNAGAVTLADSVSVTSWNLTTPTITTSLTTSTPITLTAAELDRLDGLAGIIATDTTAVTDLEGTLLSISGGILNATEADTLDVVTGRGAITTNNLRTGTIGIIDGVPSGVELYVAGEAGISSDLTIGGTLTVAETASISSDLTLSETLFVDRIYPNTSGEPVDIVGEVAVSSDLTVGGVLFGGTPSIQFSLDGAGSALSADDKAHTPRARFGGTIVKAYMGTTDQTGSVTVDIWKQTFGTVATDANSITGTQPLVISSDVSMSMDVTLGSTWTRTFNQGDTFTANVDSAATTQNVPIILEVDPDTLSYSN